MIKNVLDIAIKNPQRINNYKNSVLPINISAIDKRINININIFFIIIAVPVIQYT